MLAEALCCERVRCLPSIWVSYRGQRFKCSSLLHAGTSCASTRAYYVCWSVGVCKHECWDAYMWMCPRPCINILYVCLRVIGPCRCLGSCVYTARRVSIFVLGSLPAGIMNMLPLGACGTQAHYCLLNSRW